MTCPECGSSDIRESRSAHWSKLFQQIFGRQPFRCRKCRRRFFASDSTASAPERAANSKDTRRPARLMTTRTKKRLVRRLIVISIFSLAFVLFLLFLGYLTTEHMSSSDSGSLSSPLSGSVGNPD